MINLRAIYGNKIFDRKASYRSARYIPFVVTLFLDLVIVWAKVSFLVINGTMPLSKYTRFCYYMGS